MALSGRAQVLAGAILNGALRLHGPLVVHVDVFAHARVRRALLLLVLVVAVVVEAADARHVVRQRVELQPLPAHLILVYRRR